MRRLQGFSGVVALWNINFCGSSWSSSSCLGLDSVDSMLLLYCFVTWLGFAFSMHCSKALFFYFTFLFTAFHSFPTPGKPCLSSPFSDANDIWCNAFMCYEAWSSAWFQEDLSLPGGQCLADSESLRIILFTSLCTLSKSSLLFAFLTSSFNLCTLFGYSIPVIRLRLVLFLYIWVYLPLLLGVSLSGRFQSSRGNGNFYACVLL